jgi:FkbH-like protein
MNQLLFPFDATKLQRNKLKLKKDLLFDGSKRITKKIAILAGSTANEIKDMLELFLLDNGIQPEFYLCEFGKYWEDIMFENPELIAFKPDLVFFHTSNRNIQEKPNVSDKPQDTEAKLENEFSRFTGLWEKTYSLFKCPIIQNDFDFQYYRLLGNKDLSDYRGFNNFILRLNQRFYDYAASHDYLKINDLSYLQATYGIEKFSDPLFWHMYKYAIAVPYIPYFSFNLASIIKAIYGKNKKAFVLDLDNTLWGGVIGDDGVEGIQLGHETSMGQAFDEFQQYLKDVSLTGVMLTVDSKNEKSNALKGINHPEGVLKEKDFITIVANWEPKSENVHAIAKTLNIGEEALVFVDDNPAEREIIKQQAPTVVAPDIGEVTNYISTLDKGGYFECVSLSEDDLSRNEMYKANALRSEAQSSYADYGEYLTSLKMEATIKNFEAIYLQRIAQLTNKSNQFNLTTKRFSEEEMVEASKDPQRICLYGKLVDKFGDNGVVTVVIGKEESPEVLGIELWLMSCRVLKRDMEEAMLDELVRLAKARGYQKLKGYFFPTAKNAMVKDFYAHFGFSKVQEDAAGNTIWSLPLKDYKDKNIYIEVNKK